MYIYDKCWYVPLLLALCRDVCTSENYQSHQRACVYDEIKNTCTHMYFQSSFKHTHTHTHPCYICTWTHTYVHTYMYTCIQTHRHTQTDTHVIPECVSKHACIHARIQQTCNACKLTNISTLYSTIHTNVHEYISIFTKNKMCIKCIYMCKYIFIVHHRHVHVYNPVSFETE